MTNGIKRRHSRGKLSAILNVLQHSREHPRNRGRSDARRKRTLLGGIHVINRTDTTLVMQFAHGGQREQSRCFQG